MMDTDTGLPAGLAYGSVPSSLPQTSQAGEYAAFAAICNLARKPTKVMSDCANVVKDWNRLGVNATLRKKTYAGLLAESGKANNKLD